MKEHVTRRFSLARALFWAALLIPSYFFGWVYSVAFVAVCSLYANFASDFAAWRADSNKEVFEKLNEIENLLSKLIEKEVKSDR